MNLNSRVTRLENELFGVDANPLLTGAYTYHSHIIIGGPEQGTREWVRNNETGQCYEVTPEWRKLNDEYTDAMLRAGTPVEYDVIIGTPLTTNDE